jgi:hypothetical protein
MAWHGVVNAVFKKKKKEKEEEEEEREDLFTSKFY